MPTANPNHQFFAYQWKANELKPLKDILAVFGMTIQGPEENILPHSSDVDKMKAFYVRRYSNSEIIEMRTKVADMKTSYETLKAQLDGMQRVGNFKEYDDLAAKVNTAKHAFSSMETKYRDRMGNNWDSDIGNDVSADYPFPLKYEPFRIYSTGHVNSNIIKDSVVIKPKMISILTDIDNALTSSIGGADSINVVRNRRFLVNVNIVPEQILNVSYDIAVPV